MSKRVREDESCDNVPPLLPIELWLTIFCHSVSADHIPLQFVAICHEWNKLSGALLSKKLSQWVTLYGNDSEHQTEEASYAVFRRHAHSDTWHTTAIMGLQASREPDKYSCMLYRALLPPIKDALAPSLRFYRQVKRWRFSLDVVRQYAKMEPGPIVMGHVYYLETTPPVYHLLTVDMYAPYMKMKRINGDDAAVDENTPSENVCYDHTFTLSDGRQFTHQQSVWSSPLVSHTWPVTISGCSVVYDPGYVLDASCKVSTSPIYSERPVDDIVYYLNMDPTLRSVRKEALLSIIDELTQKSRLVGDAT